MIDDKLNHRKEYWVVESNGSAPSSGTNAPSEAIPTAIFPWDTRNELVDYCDAKYNEQWAFAEDTDVDEDLEAIVSEVTRCERRDA